MYKWDTAVSECESTAVLMKNSIECTQEIYTSKICIANEYCFYGMLQLN